MTYLKVAQEVLEQSENPMKLDEIWNKAVELGLDKEIEKTLGGKMSKTPIASLGAVIYSDIKYNPDETIFRKTEKGKFFLKGKPNPENNDEDDNQADNITQVEDDDEDDNQADNTNQVSEAHLHKPLTKYLHNMKIFSKTINANSTGITPKGKMKWGTPDIVGVTFKDYINKSILELFNHINLPTTQLYAFILKYYYDENTELFSTDDEIQSLFKITKNKKTLITKYPIELSDIYYAETTYNSNKKIDLIKKLMDIFDREDELIIKYQ